MIAPGKRANLLLEPRQSHRIRSERWREHLQGDDAVQAALLGEVHHPHSAPTELSQDLKFPKERPGGLTFFGKNLSPLASFEDRLGCQRLQGFLVDVSRHHPRKQILKVAYKVVPLGIFSWEKEFSRGVAEELDPAPSAPRAVQKENLINDVTGLVEEERVEQEMLTGPDLEVEPAGEQLLRGDLSRIGLAPEGGEAAKVHPDHPLLTFEAHFYLFGEDEAAATEDAAVLEEPLCECEQSRHALLVHCRVGLDRSVGGGHGVAVRRHEVNEIEERHAAAQARRIGSGLCQGDKSLSNPLLVPWCAQVTKDLLSPGVVRGVSPEKLKDFSENGSPLSKGRQRQMLECGIDTPVPLSARPVSGDQSRCRQLHRRFNEVKGVVVPLPLTFRMVYERAKTR